MVRSGSDAVAGYGWYAAICLFIVSWFLSIAVGESSNKLEGLKIEAAKKGYAEFVYDLEKRKTVFKWNDE